MRNISKWFKKEEPQLLKLTRKVDLYYGLCGFKIDTIHIPVKDYLSFRPHYDNAGYKVGNDTELMLTFDGYGGPAYEVTIKEGGGLCLTN